MTDLASKYRPQTFEEVLGQSHIINALKSFQSTDKWPHAFLFTGGSGQGKCISGETLILTEKGLLPINYFSEFYGYTPLELQIFSKEGIDKTSFFYKEEVNNTIKIKDSLGYELEGTPEHPILILDENYNLIFRKLKDLKITDKNIIFVGSNYFSKNNKELNFEQIKKIKDTNSILITNLPKFFNEKLATLLGYVIANGCKASLTSPKIIFCSNNEIINNDIKGIIRELGYTGELNSYQKENKTISYSLGGEWYGKFITYLLGKPLQTARFKEVPLIVLQSTKECQSAFLRALFDCDSAYYSGNIEYLSASKILVDQVQAMLLNFGIVCNRHIKRVKNYDHDYHILTISSFYVDVYFTEIGSLKYTKENCIRNTNIHGIACFDYVGKILENLKNTLKVNKAGQFLFEDKYERFPRIFGRARNLFINKQFTKILTKTYALDILIAYEEFIVKYNLQPDNEFIYKLKHIFSNSNFTINSITKIEYLTHEKGKNVYDFTIPKSHCFISNGFISHNTSLARLIAKGLGVTASNLIEYDGATHSGVDNVRALIETLPYGGFEASQKRMVILDECHSLSKAAWQAFLKTIEEPPSHIYFAFCTTEAEKVPDTIKTRCNVFNVKPTSVDDLFDLLFVVSELENFQLKPEILQLVSLEAEGSPRRALNFLSVVRGCTSKQQAAKALESAQETEELRSLCSLLISGNATWEKALPILKNLDTQNMEGIRIGVLAYVSKVLLNTTSAEKAARLCAILDQFKTPWHTPSEKMAPLLLAVGTLLFGE